MAAEMRLVPPVKQGCTATGWGIGNGAFAPAKTSLRRRDRYEKEE
jgi:hypothetical protein